MSKKHRMPLELTGIVTVKRIEETEVHAEGADPDLENIYHYICVSGLEYNLLSELYDSVAIGREVTVTLETRWWMRFLINKPRIRSISHGISAGERDFLIVHHSLTIVG
jgi:hypothetical protein